MSSLMRKLFRRGVPGVRHKAKWIKNEDEIVNLFGQYLRLNQTTLDEVKAFLSDNHISFKITTLYSQTDSPSEELFFVLPGPPAWKGLLPIGSVHQVRFSFSYNILSNINVYRVIYDL